MPVVTHAVPTRVAAYGMSAPTLGSLRAAVLTSFDEPTWSGLLAAAGVTGGHTDAEAVERVVTTMCAHPDRLLALHGRSQRVRLCAYAHVAAGHDRFAA